MSLHLPARGLAAVIVRHALVASSLTACLAGATAQTPQFDAWFEADNFAAVDKEIARLAATSADDRTLQLARARLGLALPDDGRIEAGLAAMDACLARNEADYDCQLWAGRLLGRKALEAGMVSGIRYAGRIRAHFERAVALRPDALEARYDLHQFYILAPSIAGGGKGKARDGIAAFARLRPAEAELLQAQLDLAEERHADAERRVLGYPGSEQRELRGVWKDLLTAVGFTHLSAKPPRLDQAQRVFEQAAARFPRDELFLRGLGRVAQEQGRLTQAAELFERAIAIKPQPGAHYRLAQVAEKLGDVSRAITHYEKTLRFPRGVPRSILTDANERLKALQSLAPARS